ncbi:beta-propeller domain-containing protein [Algibacillus agarilyticus]|uniref:beta-propeller domain-containing protein n=1 Tax=Algibacillus agarilyticus TaxID=2234133 RepID=UPI000DD032D7|nr:beta-propeller domain-containing protein [Algibacillus agarilyticus]
MKHAPNYLKLSAVSASLIALASCGSDNTVTPPTQQTDEPFEIIQLNAPTPTLAKLKKTSSADETKTRLKNSLLQTTNQNYFTKTSDTIETALPSVPQESADAVTDDSSDGGSTDDFSQTNLIEANVDEADFVKYNGNTLFVSVNKYNHSNIDTAIEPFISDTLPSYSVDSYIRVLQPNNDNVMQEIAKIDAPTDTLHYDNLYLNGDTLTAFAHENQYFWSFRTWGYPNVWQNGSFDVLSYDIGTPSTPTALNQIKISGHLVQSRRIGDKLYVLSQFSPTYPTDLIYYPKTEEDYQTNAQQVEQLTDDQLFPTISINDQTPVLLGSMDDCYIPETSDEKSSYGNILSVTVFDINNLAQFESSCLNTYNDGFYMSENAMYITSHVYDSDSLAIHKLDLTDTGVTYAATGIVPGYLGWRGMSFKMNEKDDLLRVMTTRNTNDNNDRFDHNLYILQTNESTNTLEPIAQLPNAQNPKKIGKDNEDIFAIRYFGDKAYVVTFEQIDPLYVIDLSVPNAPVITGELEIPGFSTYLHPLGENYVMGIGEDANVQRGFGLIEPAIVDPINTSDTETESTSPVNDEIEDVVNEGGIKLGLFDVSDINNPVEMQSYVLGDHGTWSQALYEHKALSILKTGDTQYKFAIPATVYNNSPTNGWWQWQYTGLELFNIDLANSTAPLVHTGTLKTEVKSATKTYQTYNASGRGIIQGERVHYVQDSYVWSADWIAAEDAVGPN